MALPELHPVNEVTVQAFSRSIGASPEAAYVRVPFRGRVLKVGCVTQGAITTADAAIATAINGAAITGGAITVTVAGAAAGQCGAGRRARRQRGRRDLVHALGRLGRQHRRADVRRHPEDLMRAASRLGTNTTFTLSGSSQATAAFGSQTYQVRVAAGAQPAYVRIDDGTPTAAATDPLMPANTIDYFTVTPGQKLACLQAGTAGTLSVTEMT